MCFHSVHFLQTFIFMGIRYRQTGRGTERDKAHKKVLLQNSSSRLPPLPNDSEKKTQKPISLPFTKFKCMSMPLFYYRFFGLCFTRKVSHFGNKGKNSFIHPCTMYNCPVHHRKSTRKGYGLLQWIFLAWHDMHCMLVCVCLSATLTQSEQKRCAHTAQSKKRVIFLPFWLCIMLIH